MNRILTAAAVFVLFGFTGPPLLQAGEIEGVTFKETLTVDGQKLQLKNTALLKHLVVIKAYVGGLYLPAPVSPGNVLSADIPKALVLHYFHRIPAADFAEATTAVIRENVSDAVFRELEPRIDQMNMLYRDVNPGDEYRAAYIPGVGTSLARNGETLGTVPGSNFARAYFSIWLGENPISESFRDRLLGR
mgnify:FL=1